MYIWREFQEPPTEENRRPASVRFWPENVSSRREYCKTVYVDDFGLRHTHLRWRPRVVPSTVTSTPSLTFHFQLRAVGALLEFLVSIVGCSAAASSKLLSRHLVNLGRTRSSAKTAAVLLSSVFLSS